MAAELLQRLSSHPWALAAWPAFLAAAVLEIVVFGWVDPRSLPGIGERATPTEIYSLAFFVFWAVIVLACVTTLRLAAGPNAGAAAARTEEPPHAR